MKNMQKGFTLIELMIVVAIIAILAAIAIPAYQDYLIRSQVTEGITLMDGAKVAATEYYANHGAFPPSQLSAGLATDTSIAGSYVHQVDLASTGVITAKFQNGTPQKANTAIDGKTIALSPTTIAGGTIKWTCITTPKDSVAIKYAPSTCR